MKLRRKNKRVEKELPSILRAGLARFNQGLIQVAGYLQEKTNAYSSKKKKILLGVFIAVFLTESSRVIIQSINHKTEASITVARIRTIPLQSKNYQTLLITKEEFFKVQKFKNYIDSLSTTPKGRKFRDSILRSRPHLMDSVNFLVNQYLEQSKTLVK